VPSRYKKTRGPHPGRRDVLERFSALSWGSRLFLWARWVWTPYVEMASLLPVKGRILDGGCGHGLFSLALALQSPKRNILGLDHSRIRIAAARSAARGIKNISFKIGDYTVLPRGPFDGIALIDVLHYLPYEKQARVLKNSAGRLRRGGILLFREVDRSLGMASGYNRLHETLMIRLGFTQAEGLHFRDAAGWKKLAQQAGFLVRMKPTARFPFADILYRCEKP
jgi:2-polyprenyl-3-methyl-5-hydroxy-6-metoxy-1,4-benzoquinol methylase